MDNNWSYKQKQAYFYVLGLYLGDGCIDNYPRTHRLRIFLHTINDIAVRERAIHCMSLLFPRNKVSYGPHGKTGQCTAISIYNCALPILFPQHGDGKKNSREILLDTVQTSNLDEYGDFLLCGLIDSDGSRYFRLGHKNKLTYQFTNTSTGILTIYKNLLQTKGISFSSTKKKQYKENCHDTFNILTQKLTCAEKLDNICNINYNLLMAT